MISAIVRMAADLGVDYAQGYLLGRPSSLAEYDVGARRDN
jgi:EAL domain-containing protein (putative c-di-GMP-specific phosphodiesterase class I)